METILKVLTWLAGGGCVVVVSWFASWFMEEFNFWQVLNSKVKQVIVLIFAILLGCGAVSLLQDPILLDKLAPYLLVVVTAMGAWIATQKAHGDNPKRTPLIEIGEISDTLKPQE